MKLEVFERTNRTRVDIIRNYDYVYYEDEYNEPGKFEIRIPTTDTSLDWLTYNNWILFDDGVLGIIKGIKTVEDSDDTISIYGYLSNHILEFRSFLVTANYYETPVQIALSMFDDLYVHPEDSARTISFLEASNVVPSWTGKIRYQSTGKTLLETLYNMFEPYGLGFELYPVVENYQENPLQYANIDKFLFKIIKPANRTIGNQEGNTPVVFSFDLNNLQRLEYEEDSQTFATVAIVASEGVGEERKIIEVNNTPNPATGYSRIELYVDARDIQTDSDPENPMTDEELEEVMLQRGKEKLEEHQKFISFDASILEGKYKYGVDFYKGDYVSVISKFENKIFDVQVTSIKKTYSNGVEHLDITLGTDRMKVRQLKERRFIYNV